MRSCEVIYICKYNDYKQQTIERMNDRRERERERVQCPCWGLCTPSPFSLEACVNA